MARQALVTGMALATWCLGGCGSDATGPAPQDISKAYWALQLNHEAIEMALTAPYDTVQLAVTPVTAAGTPLPSFGTVTYTVADSNVTVSPTGLITAQYETTNGPIAVVAALRDATRGVTHIDTAFIVVTVSPAPLGSFSLQPAAGDSAKRSLDYATYFPLAWPVVATDAAHDTVCNPIQCSINVRYRSSNPSVAVIDDHTGTIVARDTGHTILTASTYAYGKAWRDSVDFRVGMSLHYPIYITDVGYISNDPSLPVTVTAPSKIFLGVGAILDFRQIQNFRPFRITFSDSANVDSVTDDVNFIPETGRGNISFACDSLAGSCASQGQVFRARRFIKEGVYLMHITLLPSSVWEIHIVKE